MTNLSLFQISQDFSQLNNLIEMDENNPEFIALLDNISAVFKDKVTNIAYLIRNLEASADGIKEAEKAMSNRRKAIESKAERLRKYLIDNMITSDQLKIECPYFAISIRNNPPSVNINDIDSIPFEYFDIPKPIPQLNKNRLKEDLKSGLVIGGASLVSDKSLQIK